MSVRSATLCVFLAESALRLGDRDQARAYAEQGRHLIGEADFHLSQALQFQRGLAVNGRA